MNILLACLSYREFTGSEIYFYELSSALRDAGHNVSIYTPFPDSPLIDKTSDITFPLRDDINKQKYDLLIFSHGKVLWDYLKTVTATKTINVIHSEVLELEAPIINNKVDLYVGIRPSIIEYIKSFNINKPTRLIYNPFDFNRFNPDNCKKKKSNKEKIVLFPGSLDYLRYQPLRYLLDLSVKQNFKVLHVGRNDYSTVHPHFTTQEPGWYISRTYIYRGVISW